MLGQQAQQHTVGGAWLQPTLHALPTCRMWVASHSSKCHARPCVAVGLHEDPSAVCTCASHHGSQRCRRMMRTAMAYPCLAVKNERLDATRSTRQQTKTGAAPGSVPRILRSLAAQVQKKQARAGQHMCTCSVSLWQCYRQLGFNTFNNPARHRLKSGQRSEGQSKSNIPSHKRSNLA